MGENESITERIAGFFGFNKGEHLPEDRAAGFALTEKMSGDRADLIEAGSVEEAREAYFRLKEDLSRFDSRPSADSIQNWADSFYKKKYGIAPPSSNNSEYDGDTT